MRRKKPPPPPPSHDDYRAALRDPDNWVAEITAVEGGGYRIQIVNTKSALRWGVGGLPWFTRSLSRARRIAERQLAKKRALCLREQIDHARVAGKEVIR